MLEPDAMRTDARRVRYLGASHTGTRALWHMRLTSLALVPLTIAFVFLVLSLLGKSYAEVHATLSHPFPSILMLLFIGTGVYHMQIGMRAIIEDYVHDNHLKEYALAANLFLAAAIGVTCIYAVLKLSFS